MEKIEVGEILTLSYDEGDEQDYEVLGSITIESHEYIAVGLLEEVEKESEEDIDVFFLRVEEDGEFYDIETEEEFEKVSAAFDEVLR
ncbi:MULTISPECIES: DUF1292 domain-containing protein [Bacillaceae]|jgi:uncharacterized protein YrzB (UPF0473 family)|uniref:Cyclopropane-fatty-acyl-phospholipid synthase n=1 Tax=Gottfriedia luciferensis TaxID=178774 RepID=A0ABX2ZM45_9BACI|nr:MULTISPECIES: DUF1292 domain-containing protein [Bacillaceae]ODG90786.1 cyclopropane-fatty-acyl-phospholipid synthase [Gottfriedia luciferensis]PGZ90544.1 DUF1292 domain-containing protein [Bacillus sp. AFS029533]SFD28615.1 Protein of unknown function [Bacillus sp. UNCCL81]